MEMLSVLLKDAYKAFHKSAYHPEVTHVYGNFTNRFGKYSNTGGDFVVHVGPQQFVKRILIEHWDEYFFCEPRDYVINEYKRVIGAMLGCGASNVDATHIGDLYDLGYLPLEIKSLPEGSKVPYGVPTVTVKNTIGGFGWLTNMIETVMSAEMWGISTSATTSYFFRKAFEDVAEQTGLSRDMIPFMCHDFSYRGMFGTEAAMLSGFGHLTSSVGSDTIPAALFAEKYYNACIDKELVFASVNATEHSVMCSYGTEGELDSLIHLLDNVCPTGILSVVSDTWDFWKLVTEYLPAIKEKIMSRDGTLVIRPDSGDPVDILCGTGVDNTPEGKGLIECLWDTFGGVINDKGFKQLDSHIGAIYGDSITLERQQQIINKLIAKGFVPQVVLGVGSFTYQYVTRDTHGSAVKATSMQKGAGNYEEMFKDPKTDSSKKSAKGLMRVEYENGGFVLYDQQTPEQEGQGCLEVIFKDGNLVKETSLQEIRSRLWN